MVDVRHYDRTNRLMAAQDDRARSRTAARARPVCTKMSRRLRLLLLTVLPAVTISCIEDAVALSFDQTNIVVDNLDGADSGQPANIRVKSVGLVGGRSIDLVMSTVNSLGAAGRCVVPHDNNCDFSVNSNSVGNFKVAQGSDLMYDVLLSFQFSDDQAAATLPKLALTWLDMGGREFVVVESATYDDSFAGSRLVATDNWDTGFGWHGTHWVSSINGNLAPVNVIDPMAMTADQQSAALQVHALSPARGSYTARHLLFGSHSACSLLYVPAYSVHAFYIQRACILHTACMH